MSNILLRLLTAFELSPPTPKTRCKFSTTNFGSYLAVFCLVIDRQFLLFNDTHSTIFHDIVFSDLTSHTCIISNMLLDRDKKVSIAGIGAIKYIINIYNIVV